MRYATLKEHLKVWRRCYFSVLGHVGRTQAHEHYSFIRLFPYTFQGIPHETDHGRSLTSERGERDAQHSSDLYQAAYREREPP
jgi:hypothetical protein